MRLASRKIRTQRQQRLGSLERLDLRLLIDTEHDGMGWRMKIETDHVSDFFFGQGIGAELEGLHPMRLEAWACQMRWTVLCETPTRSASSRVLHCASPGGGVRRVRATMRALLASVSRGGRPERGLSSEPATPSSANRLRIRLIWTGV